VASVSNVESFTTSTSPGAEQLTPTCAFLIVADAMLADVAPDSTTIPYHALAADEAAAAKVTPLSAVPFTISAPATWISTRDASSPLADASLVATCTTVPAWIVSEVPAGTTMSPWITYGLPAAVQV
jgi:hypothetical protein